VGSLVFTDDRKAEVFNSYFNSVNVDDNGTLPDFPHRAKADVSLDTVEFTTEKIHKVIRKHKPKHTGNPEDFSPYLVKQLITALPVPLLLLFSSFLSVGKIPSSWKNAIITPIYKKGLSSDPANYRPISLRSVFGKLMERVIAVDMTNYLLTNKLLNPSQYGFLSKRSTLTNLVESVNDWTVSIENKVYNRVAYIDFSRAFDSVSHVKLLYKLSPMVLMAFFSIGLLTFCQNVHTLLESVAPCRLLVIFEVVLYKVVVSVRSYIWFT